MQMDHLVYDMEEITLIKSLIIYKEKAKFTTAVKKV